MFRNQLTALFTHERITTTLAKAKELRPMAEKMVTLAGTGTLPARRKILTMVSDKDVVRRLFDDIAPRFTDRPGGYTRIMRLGRRRGDGAEMAIVEFVDYELSDHEDGGGAGSGKTSLMDRAKGIFGGRGEADAAGTEADEAVEAAAEDSDDGTADEPVAEAEAGDEPVEEEAVAETAEPEKVAESEAADEPETEASAEPEAADEAEAEAEPADEADEKKDA
jgi:large subunit ribosomal protein L17